MIAPSIAPSLADLVPAPSLAALRRDLDRAETELACADMIDNAARRRIEMDRCQARVDRIKAQIAQIEETF